MKIKIDIDKIINFLVRKSLFILIIGFILIVIVFEFAYWKYVYLPAHTSFEQEVIESKIERDNLKSLIKNIEEREKNYLQSLNKEYKNPFQ